MSLYALPVTSSDLTSLQQGIGFSTNPTDAQTQATAITDAAGASPTVFSYATSLLAANISLSQVAMADFAFATGKTDTVSHLGGISTGFLPTQVAFAKAQGLSGGPTVYAAQVYAVALARDTTNGFATSLASQVSGGTFVTTTAALTGTNATAIQNFFDVWNTFYKANPGAAPGLTASVAAAASAWGDAMGVALGRTDSGAGIDAARAIQNAVANALFDNAQSSSSPPGVKYAEGVAIGSLPTHTNFQGEGGGGRVFLTTGIDNATQGFSTSSTGSPLLNGFTATANNTTVTGTFGSAGATWTPNDQVIATSGTGHIFNINGIGTGGVIDPTSVAGNKVSGFQTVNITANSDALAGTTNQAVNGDFTATGTEGAWTGMTALNIASAGNGANADAVKVDPTVALSITDSLTAATTAALTVTGSLTTTITENNAFNNGGITVNGGTGTTTVSVKQTEAALGNDGIVNIIDANGASTTAPGTITKVTLDGLAFITFPGGVVTGPNMIIDNALTDLTVNNSEANPALNTGLLIVNNLTTPTATTLNLSLSNDGVNAAGVGVADFTLRDVNNEIKTIHLSVPQSSVLDLFDDGLTTLDTPTPGTGALVFNTTTNTPSAIRDNVAAAVNFDFSGLNGANNIEVIRGATTNNDTYTLGNFGTDNLTPTASQALTITNGNIGNLATINFGSGAYKITDAIHNVTHTYVNTAPDGVGLAAGLPGEQQFADIINTIQGDMLTFKGTTVQNIFNDGLFNSLAAGIADALTHPQNSATAFQVGGNSFLFDHAGTSGINVSPTDSLVGLIGVTFNANILTAGGVIQFA